MTCKEWKKIPRGKQIQLFEEAKKQAKAKKAVIAQVEEQAITTK